MVARTVVATGGQRGHDAIVVGSGPNGLAAAITLAQHGRRVLVLEGADIFGGGMRSEPLTLPGFVHDVCSAVHPFGLASPFFQRLPLAEHGLRWVHPPVPLVHPLDDGTAVVLERSVRATAQRLGRDGAAYAALFGPMVRQWERLYPEVLGPALHVPRHPFLLARFGLRALPPAVWLARRLFRDAPARAMFAGIAAHATLPLDQSPSAAFAVMLGVAGHAVGWPLSCGGSAAIAAAMLSYLRSLGGEVVTGRRVRTLDELPPTRLTLLDVTARQFLQIAGDRLPPRYREQLANFKYGLGTFKVDWALDGPIPWRADDCHRTATVHLGGTLDEMEAGRRLLWQGQTEEYPFAIIVQPTLFDPSRAPSGKQVAWGYCHVPNGSTDDMTNRIEAQVERFAPGFRHRIIGRHTMGPAELEKHNPNLVGGDINGGEATLRQLVFRPAARLRSYRTLLPGVYLCSASTPPGGGVHGMCGYHAANAALAEQAAQDGRAR